MAGFGAWGTGCGNTGHMPRWMLGEGRGGGRPERRPCPLRPPPRVWGAVSGGEARAHRVAGALAPAPPRRAPHVPPASGARTRKRVRRPCLRVDASASRPDPRRALVRDLGNPHGVVSAAVAVADAGFCWVTAATTWVPGIVAGWAPPTPGVAVPEPAQSGAQGPPGQPAEALAWAPGGVPWQSACPPPL